MIKTLRLENFQSHHDSIIELDPHFSCLIGIGNVGKSAIIRALNLLFYNKWDKSWVTLGTTHCTITATLVDGTTLVRKKGNKVNEYTIIYADGKVEKYENFGTTIPSAIQNILKIFAIELPGGEEIKLNLHSQFDLPLLKSVSPADKAKLFGQLSGLDILDSVSQELASDKNKAQSAVRLREEELEQVNKKLESFIELPQFREVLENLRKQLETFQLQDKQLQALQQLKQRIIIFKERYNYVSEQLKRYTFVGEVDTELIENQLSELKERKTLQNRIKNWKLRQSQIQQKLQEVEGELAVTKQAYIDALQETGVCPTCKTSVTQECLDQVVSEL
jgi:DNA repair protein SbcC/Rad50